MINGDSKGVNNRHVWFGSITIRENTEMNTVFLWLPHRKCMVKILIDHKYYVRHLNEKILKYFSGPSSTTNESTFKIMCNCIHELLNVFEDPAQCVHTIVKF